MCGFSTPGLIQSTISYQPQPPASIGINEFALHIYQYYTKYFNQDAATAVQQMVTFFTNQFAITVSTSLPVSNGVTYLLQPYSYFFICVFYAMNTIPIEPPLRFPTQSSAQMISMPYLPNWHRDRPSTRRWSGKSKWMIYALIACLGVAAVYYASKHSSKRQRR